tara:strand:- start:281 stop:433 length:153 start_codon:yes stop_codon:yes gene_type:complete
MKGETAAQAKQYDSISSEQVFSRLIFLSRKGRPEKSYFEEQILIPLVLAT